MESNHWPIPNSLENTLRKIEQLNQEHSYWCVSKEVGMFLKDLALSIKAKTVFEIGTSIGYSALWLVQSVIPSNGKLYTLESHKERFALAKSHFSESGVAEYIEQIKGHAPEIFSEYKLKNSIDFAFIDGVKKGTISYVEAILPRMSKKFIIVVDNINSHQEEMAPFLEWLKEKKIKHQIKNLGEGLAIIQNN